MKDTGTSVSEIVSFLIKENFLTQKQADYAVRVHAKLTAGKTLIDTLKDLKYIRQDQIKEALRRNHLSLRIGDLLVEFGYLSREKLEIALNIQKTEPHKRLGEIITENQFISENDLIEALSLQLGFEFIDLAAGDIPPELLQNIPVKWCRSNHFIPVRKTDGVITVAFADPFSKEDITAAKKLLGANIEIGIASGSQIDRILDQMESGKSKVRTIVDENTAIGIVNALIESAIEKGASDIHLEPFSDKLQIRFRIDGILVFQKDFGLDAAPMVAARIKVLSRANIAEKRRHQDGRMTYEFKGNSYDLRVSVYATVFGEKIVLRVLNRIDQIIQMSDIGMQPKMLERFSRDVLDAPSGVLIITGPTGSGKTTTLYSCVNEIKSPQISIITAEDPVEYVMEGIAQCSINPAINLTYEETLRHVVRQDPDVIVIGEIRDNYSAEVAVHAALTGHKVLTSFHTEDSISGLIRLMNMDIEAFLISSTVVCVLAQRLLRRVCPKCKEPYKPQPRDFKLLGYTLEDIGRYEFTRGKGCSHCNHTGYRGRVAVFEMLILNEYVREAILSHKSSYDIRTISVETTGLVTLMEEALSKVAAGITTFEELFRCIPRLIPPRPIHEINRLLGV